MKCANCSNWTLERATVYEDGSRIVTYTAPVGKGHCDTLNLDTVPEFGCLSFAAGDHVKLEHKTGAPWQHWKMIACPECNRNPGVGSGFMCRCAGTGNVRRYDDGYVGDEKTRMHPKE